MVVERVFQIVSEGHDCRAAWIRDGPGFTNTRKQEQRKNFEKYTHGGYSITRS